MQLPSQRGLVCPGVNIQLVVKCCSRKDKASMTYKPVQASQFHLLQEIRVYKVPKWKIALKCEIIQTEHTNKHLCLTHSHDKQGFIM